MASSRAQVAIGLVSLGLAAAAVAGCDQEQDGQPPSTVPPADAPAAAPAADEAGEASENETAQAAARPDLDGVWTNASLTGLTRPDGVETLVVDAAEAERIAAGVAIAGVAPSEADRADFTDPSQGAPEAGSRDFGLRGYNAFWIDPGATLARVRGEYRTSYIVDPPDGRIPIRTDPEAARRLAGVTRYVTGVGGNDHPEELPLSERCLIGFSNTGGPGMLSALYNNTYQFVQTPDHVMILVEMVHDARIIPTFDTPEEARAAHRPDAIKPWLGDSVGWYEDGALLVETINVRPEQARAATVRISDQGRIIERFERVSEDEIVYAFTVEDASLYTQPWRAELSFHATPGPVYEYACHEGNYAMTNILRGARLKEQRAAEAAASAG